LRDRGQVTADLRERIASLLEDQPIHA